MQSIASAMSFLAVFSAILSVAFWWLRPNSDSRKALARLRDNPGDPGTPRESVSFGKRIGQLLQRVGTAIRITRARS